MQRTSHSMTAVLRSVRCSNRMPVSPSSIQSHNQTSHVPCRGFAKRVHINGVTSPPRRVTRRSDDSDPSKVRSGESLAALEAENELRLQPLVMEVMSWKPQADTRSEVEQAENWVFMKNCSARLSRRRLMQNDAISRKIRRRFEALNALPTAIRAACLLEDRTPLPSNFPLPRNCWGEPIVPEHGGLRGKEMLTAQQVKQIIHWEQREKDRA